MGGWGSYAPENGCLQRLRYTGQHSPMPIGFRTHENGIAIRFSDRLDRLPDGSTSLVEKGNYFAQAWNYRYSANYGSAEYSSLHTGVRGHDRLVIDSIHLLDDGQTLFIGLPDLQPVNQLHLHFLLGDLPAIDIFATVHRLAKPRTDLPDYQPATKAILAHPIELDLANALKRKPNPWRKKLKDARAIAIDAGQNLSFASREIRVKANESIALTFTNPDVVPHNWALLAKGSMQRVGDLVNRLINDPDAAFNHYIPASDDIICYTDIIDGKDKATIYFNAPSLPGRYPFICTFPGHWMVMNGEMIVE
jgi:azurin